ncbi:MAG: murein biosynthesis integral membrane protein MurJ, partial [Candidatus Pacebacteria bacterium]|nr:murein biosynthesis integral membrane protein MurJ [Candidatus Paceibacterota bacterium]
RYLQKEFNGLHEAAFLLGIFALLSQIIAIVRDRLFAGYFGAGLELDIYYAAFRIPDIIFVSIASFVAITVIMPFFIERIEKDKKDAQRFINSIFTIFFVVIVLVSIAMYFLIPSLVEKTMGFDEAARQQVVSFARILLLSPILLGISNIFASITQAFRNFLVYALSPVMYNIGIIIGLLVFYPAFGLVGLMYGVILGALLHLCIQLPVVISHGFFPRFSISIPFRDVKNVVFLALPRTLGLSAQQIALFILVAIASTMIAGSVAVFQFAFNLQSVPLSVIGVSYSVAAFPTLARLYSKNQTKKFVHQVITAMRHIIFWSLPILVLFVILRAQIVRTILGAGEFDWEDTRLTAAILAIFAVSIVAQSLILILVRGYYAAGKTKIPVIVNVLSAGLIIILAYVFNTIFSEVTSMRYFFESLLRIEDIPGSNVLALPAAYSAGMIVNILVLWRLFKRDFGISRCDSLRKTFRHSLYSAFMMGTVA